MKHTNSLTHQYMREKNPIIQMNEQLKEKQKD